MHDGHDIRTNPTSTMRTENEQEKVNAMALTRLGFISLAGMQELFNRAGSATVVMENRHNIRDIIPDASDRLVAVLADVGDAVRRAEAEYIWANDNKVEIIVRGDSRYPTRLLDCDDAPLVLYFSGAADLNARRVVTIVGTRHATVYGQDIIRRFIADLRQQCPSTLVVSGLAYGVDIAAHREALKNGLPTVAVLAHGMDQLYPNCHRATAKEMLAEGGLLTEYMSLTPGAKGNFVQRNRIVAGMADASILVESAEKGGGLITMRIARDYNRDCFSFPGPVNAEYSKGCNNLIRDNGAMLITSTHDFVSAMGWVDDNELQKARQEGIERQMFVDLTDDERRIVELLQQNNDMQINVIAVRADMPISKLTALLFSLEMKGVLKAMAGGCYHLF